MSKQQINLSLGA